MQLGPINGKHTDKFTFLLDINNVQSLYYSAIHLCICGGVYISLIWGAKTPWQIESKFFGGRGPWHNHAVQIWWRSVQGFLVGWGSKFAFSHRLWMSSLQHSHYRVKCDVMINCQKNFHELKIIITSSGYYAAILPCLVQQRQQYNICLYSCSAVV